VTRVRHIVGEEESMRTRRRMRFADKSFSVSNPGPEFPRSWTSGRGCCKVDSRWTPGGLQVDSRWTPGGLQVDSGWTTSKMYLGARCIARCIKVQSWPTCEAFSGLGNLGRGNRLPAQVSSWSWMARCRCLPRPSLDSPRLRSTIP